MMMLRTLLLAVVLAASTSALTTPHHLRRSAHADIAARRREAAPAPAPLAAAGTESVPALKKAKRQQACKQRATPPATTTPAVANVAPAPATSSAAPAPATSSDPAPAPAAAPANVAPAPQDSQAAPAPAPPPPAPAPAPQSAGATIGGVTSVVGVNLVGGTNSGGDGTFYDVGLGSCGDTNVDSELLVAVSQDLYDSYPGATGNPNLNPICGRTITASFNGKSVTVPVKDRCTGCNPLSLDFSPAAFNMLSDPAVGRIHGIQWHFN